MEWNGMEWNGMGWNGFTLDCFLLSSKETKRKRNNKCTHCTPHYAAYIPVNVERI